MFLHDLSQLERLPERERRLPRLELRRRRDDPRPELRRWRDDPRLELRRRRDDLPLRLRPRVKLRFPSRQSSKQELDLLLHSS